MITDADREAAATWLKNTPVTVDWLNYEDQEALVKAFAAHRQVAMIEGARLMQRLCEVEGRLAQLEDRHVGQAIRALDPATVIKEAE